MRAWLSGLLLLHVLALHTSIAAMEILSSIILLCTLICCGRRLGQQFSRLIDRSLLGLLLAWMLWVGVSLLANPAVKPFWFQFGFMRWIFVLIGLTCALQEVWSKSFEQKLIRVWSAAVIVTGLYAALQCVTGWDWIRQGAVLPQGGGIYKAVGFFSISLTFAYVFGLSAFAVFRPALLQSRTLGVAVIVSGTLGVLASMSRGAWLAAVACIFVYLLAEFRRLVLPTLALLAMLVGVLLAQGGGFASKLTQMGHLQMDHSSSVRVDLWRAYGEMFLEHPVFGVGIFSGDRYLPEYFAKLGIEQPFTSHAHNNLLQFLAGTGLLGFLFFVVASFLFFKMAWFLKGRSAWGWPLVLSHLFLQLGGLTECNFIDGEVTHALVFVWALTWMLERRK